MQPWLEVAAGGNPHSRHRAGWRAAEAVEAAIGEVATLVGAWPGEVVLTSGATEANDLALFGASRPGGRVLASAIEHPSVLEALPALADAHRQTVVLPVDRTGRLRFGALGPLGEGDLVTVIAASNEIGTLQDLARLAGDCRAAGALFHTDASQLLASEGVDVHALGIDLLSLSAHKLYGPQGIGALVVRDGISLEPRLRGGGQQGGRRAGTVPVALAVGLGVASRLAREQREADRARLAALRDRLWDGLQAGWRGIVRNGSCAHGLAGCLHVSLPGIDAEDLLLDVPEICASTGSACASGQAGPSHVLQAIGLDPGAAHGSLRFGLGRFTTEPEIDFTIARIASALAAPARALA